jgi:quercetin dioxygenase-like cupin family protein
MDHSDERSDFSVGPHHHPKSAEHFTVLEGEVRFEIDGKERIVKEGDD